MHIIHSYSPFLDTSVFTSPLQSLLGVAEQQQEEVSGQAVSGQSACVDYVTCHCDTLFVLLALVMHAHL